MKRDRILYFDMLRIVASFGVMILHICASGWKAAKVDSFEWQVLNFYDGVVRWTVPVFVMISGALFLERKHNIQNIFRKILWIITSFLFWSVLYALIGFAQGTGAGKSVEQAIRGHYHLWFLFMIAGLYLISPIVEKIVETEWIMQYFLVLALFFTFIIPQLISVFGELYRPLGDLSRNLLDKVHFHLTLGYVSYYVGGYYLSKKELTAGKKKIIYILGILGFVGTVVLTAVVSMQKNKQDLQFYDNVAINVLLESVGVFAVFRFCLCKHNVSERAERIITKLSKYSFGAYLVHPLIIEQLKHFFGISSLSFCPVFSVPLISAAVFVISYVVSCFINHIPGINKYIV